MVKGEEKWQTVFQITVQETVSLLGTYTVSYTNFLFPIEINYVIITINDEMPIILM